MPAFAPTTVADFFARFCDGLTTNWKALTTTSNGCFRWPIEVLSTQKLRLGATTIREFRSQPELRRNVQASFRRMLAFYGMAIQESTALTVTRAFFFADRSKNWISPSNHNHLRITRILKSLRLLGLEAEAAAFFDCLADIYRVESATETPGISEETFEFWQAAVS
jgi:Opioid growth factor receptor (OGFr) conserved region